MKIAQRVEKNNVCRYKRWETHGVIRSLPSSPAQTGLCLGEKEAGDHVSEGGQRETEQLYTEHIPS